ncbi:uncharacterized protein N7518_000790 [Penicillium psychrosexuale]|uniref:uncharacterized protein n=1 Tax=Penicillium psychrosexuale TaxID=1002107 RepID=UPI002545374C|nr:uncharacterized protein N7518_000790 [Penicillium psychrosexuale]KAJ5804487.1 hypothetical protein N7518_000790 [Penicillium psychrosexuale]
MGATSLSVIARKAAERVVASSFVFQGRIWRTSLSVNVRKAAERVVAQLDGNYARSNVSVCEHAEGNRTYGGFIFFFFQGRASGTSLSVNVRKAAERVVASSFFFKGWILANVSVCERAEGSRTCGGSPKRAKG